MNNRDKDMFAQFRAGETITQIHKGIPDLSYERVRQIITKEQRKLDRVEQEYETLTQLLELGEVDAIKAWIYNLQ